MCSKTSLPLVIVALVFGSIAQAGPFGSWAARGVVVNKTFRSNPLARSLGVDGIYRLELRGSDRKVRRQMVTREIYLAYEIGDRFNELESPPSHQVRLAAEAAQDAKASEEDSEAETRNRVASLNFPQEMLPETEGF